MGALRECPAIGLELLGCDRVATISSMGTGGKYREDTSVYNNTFYDCDLMLRMYEDGYNRNQRFYNNI